MGKRYNQSENQKYQQFDDDFEDFGYEVKNIRRQTKKKVAKFKREVNEYDDTYWTGTLNIAKVPLACIVYMLTGFSHVHAQIAKRQTYNARRIASRTCYQTHERSRALGTTTSGRISNQFSTVIRWHVWRLINTNSFIH